jgi:hypothetical protein
MSTISAPLKSSQDSVPLTLGAQKSLEIQRFLQDEMRGFRFARSHHDSSHHKGNHNRVIRYEADGRAILK